MPTPPKPSNVLSMEGKSHRTKDELKQRQEAEAALLTGKKMEMWPGLDKVAKDEFQRVASLLATIEKDDALYEAVVNRYAQIKSECKKFEMAIKKSRAVLREADKKYKDGEIDYLTYIAVQDKMSTNINSADRQIQAKRKMLLDIEKENVMTIAAALRSIPKTPKKEPAKNPMEKAGFNL